VFQADNNYDGHGTTRSTDWLAASSHWLAPKPLPCFESSRYEPYLVLSTFGAATPLYDERFTGYGKNKISFVNHVRLAGFKFAVLPREFLMHYPHPKSSAKIAWLRNGTLHRQVDAQFSAFLNALATQYRSQPPPATPICAASAKSRAHFSPVALRQSELGESLREQKAKKNLETGLQKYKGSSKKSLLGILSDFLA
jgi:hypothetical protein